MQQTTSLKRLGVSLFGLCNADVKMFINVSVFRGSVFCTLLIGSSLISHSHVRPSPQNGVRLRLRLIQSSLVGMILELTSVGVMKWF